MSNTYYLACDRVALPVTRLVRLLDGPHHRREMESPLFTTEILTEDGAVYHYCEFLSLLHNIETYVWEKSPHMQFTDR